MSKTEKFSTQVVQTSAQATETRLVIRAPFRPLVSGEYICRHVDARLTPKAAEKLKTIFKGLYEEHQTLSNGRHIDIPAHAVCWLLEHAEIPDTSDPSTPEI
jgi:hypothetical protein